MNRSALVALSLFVAGFIAASFASSEAFAVSAGDTLGDASGAQIKVLTQGECRDLHIDAQGDVTEVGADAVGTPSSPAQQSDITPAQLDKKTFSLGIFSFKPDGAPNRIRSDECTADHLQDIIFAHPDIGSQSAAISDFFQTCHSTVKRQGDGDLGALLKTSSTKYNACDNPRVHAVEVSMPDGTKLRGILALQDSTRALPLVIFKDGAFGNSNSASSRTALMAMFDQAPLNMLILGNVTGSDYLRDNQHIALGGFDEGMQVIEVAKLLRSSSIASRISEINVMGVSLGGQAALFTSYYNSWQPNFNGKPLISSIFAESPVVNLESSMNSLFSPGVKWKVVRKFLLGDFFEILSNIPHLEGTLSQLNAAADTSEMPGIIAKGAVSYYAGVSPSWGLAPYQGLQIKIPSDLWSRNNFLPMASMDLTTPTMVLGAQTDWVVEPADNSLALKAELDRTGDKAAIKVVMLDRGNHCAFGPSLGWDLYSALLISYEISHSPSLMARRHFETAAISDDYVKKFGKLEDDEETVDYHFEFSAKKDYMKITVDQIDDQAADNDFCDLSTEELSSDCLKRAVVKIPLSELPAAWARQPVTEADAQALTRWANTNVRLVSDDGTPVGLNNKNPASFKWVSYE